MLKNWLSRINLFLAGFAGFFLLAALMIFLSRDKEIPHFEGPIEKRHLPKTDFAVDKSNYDLIDQGPLQLKFVPLTIQLPDLRKVLVYSGKNGRPDAPQQNPLLHFSFTGNKSPTSVSPHQPTYIKYDRKQTPPQYVFSPGNRETPLWIEIEPQGNQATVKVRMLDENEQVIAEPSLYAEFVVKEKEPVRTTSASWEIGKLRVDGTLLARQKARWYGKDKFLEKHGGSEYAALANKQRIDFGGDSEQAYSIYVGADDVIVWDGTRWETVISGTETIGKPLMTVKKIDDRLMGFELWDPEGKSKTTINLLKSTESWVPQHVEQNFKFLGARTRSQFVFEVNKERIMLSPQDWLIQIDGSWKKLSTPEEIDAYVERKMIGPLFIFDGVEKKEDKQVLMGTLFNAARTEFQPIEISIQQSGKKEESSKPTPRQVPEQKRETAPPTLPSQELMRSQPSEESST